MLLHAKKITYIYILTSSISALNLVMYIAACLDRLCSQCILCDCFIREYLLYFSYLNYKFHCKMVM